MDEPIKNQKPDLDDLTDTSDHKTAVLSRNQIRRRVEQAAAKKGGTVYFGEEHQLILIIRGMVERLTISSDKTLVLGRADHKSDHKSTPDVDLTPYGALDRGVSRGHARLHIEDDKLYVTDLASTNGTFIGGEKLEPYMPRLIGKGDELVLGRLGIQVLFRVTSALDIDNS